MSLRQTLSKIFDQAGQKFDDLLGIGGLDVFELVRSIESEFKVVLSHTVCEELGKTLGDLQAWLQEQTGVSMEQIWDRMTPLIADYFGVSRDELRRETTWTYLGA